MRVPELYLSDLSLTIQCIKHVYDYIVDCVDKDIKATKRRAFFRPWAKQELLVACSIRTQMAIEVMKNLKELQDKFLESTGVDEDMRPATLKEMFKIED